MLTAIISKLWDLNTFHLLFLDLNLLTYLQWAHFPVVKTWGDKPPVAPPLLPSSRPRDRGPALLILFHILPYPLCSEHHKRWFLHTVAGCLAHAASRASWEASKPLTTAQGHFLLVCPPPTLSASSGFVPLELPHFLFRPLLLLLSSHYLWAAWGPELCIQLCVHSI